MGAGQALVHIDANGRVRGNIDVEAIRAGAVKAAVRVNARSSTRSSRRACAYSCSSRALIVINAGHAIPRQYVSCAASTGEGSINVVAQGGASGGGWVTDAVVSAEETFVRISAGETISCQLEANRAAAIPAAICVGADLYAAGGNGKRIADAVVSGRGTLINVDASEAVGVELEAWVTGAGKGAVIVDTFVDAASSCESSVTSTSVGTLSALVTIDTL